MSAPPILAVEVLGIDFGGITALREVSFEVRPGEVLGLIGPNGAGKSTLVNCICGLYRPSRGRVQVDGHDVIGVRPDSMRSRGVVRTFQETLLMDDVSLVENVVLGRTASRRRDLLASLLNLPGTRSSFRDETATADEVLRNLDIGEWRDVPARSLPYGVRKLAEVARAQLADPRLMLLDEPAAGLGTVDAEMLSDRLRTLAASGMGLVLIDHNMDFVSRTADRVVVLSAGAVLAEGTPAEIKENSDVIEAYLGMKRQPHA